MTPNTQTIREEKCKCACHDTEWNSVKLHAPVEHTSTCCEKMNGYLQHSDVEVSSEWKVGRQNLQDFAKKFPNAIADVIDSAYLAGLDAHHSDLKQRVEGKRRKVIQTDVEYNTTWRIGYNRAVDDFLTLLETNEKDLTTNKN